MGMFDKPRFLTGGDEAFVAPGDTFWIHRARIDGSVTINGRETDQAKLEVSRTFDDEREVVYSAGRGIVNQIKRANGNDFPVEVRLDQVPSRQGNPTHVLTPANEAPPSAAPSVDDSADF